MKFDPNKSPLILSVLPEGSKRRLNFPQRTFERPSPMGRETE